MYSSTTILGNVTKDPVLQVLPNDARTTEFCVVTNRRFKDSQDQLKEEAEFHWCQAWGRKAEVICNIVSRGDLLFIQGRNKTEKWEDKNTGQPRNRTVIVLEDFRVANRKDYRNEEKENED